MSTNELNAQQFLSIPDVLHELAVGQPDHIALQMNEVKVSYSELDALMDRIAASLQSAGVGSGDVVALCASASVEYIAAFLASIRIGAVAAPLPQTTALADLVAMVVDSGAKLIFWDKEAEQRLARSAAMPSIIKVSFDDADDENFLPVWMMPPGVRPAPVEIDPGSGFNIIYSSGTTGTPKGIVQSHGMRSAHMRRAGALGYSPDAVSLISSQLYSNLTLVSLLPTLVRGGTAVLMEKFDAREYLQIAERVGATHTFLVPVQFQRILEVPDFDGFDLSSFRLKVCAGAPCVPELKREILDRWPGELIDLFGMTEGGATTMLLARNHPDKLHTVGRPQEGHVIRILRDDGSLAETGETGEVVGHSEAMMIGYHNQPAKTREAEWHDAEGRRYIRTGDIGKFDEDGFLVLIDRKKDMIISGGFNVYPSDLEAVLRQHEAVCEAAVVGIPSAKWGETPAAFVVLDKGAEAEGEQIRIWANERLGKTQRITSLEIVDSLPRSAINKILKGALRDRAIARLK